MLHLAADDGVNNPNAENFIFGNGHYILNENCDISQFAGHQAPFYIFFKSSIGRIQPERWMNPWLESYHVAELDQPCHSSFFPCIPIIFP